MSNLKKRWSISLVIRDMQIKAIIRYYDSLTSMAIINKTDNHSIDENVGDTELSCINGGSERWQSHFVKHFGSSVKMSSIDLTR